MSYKQAIIPNEDKNIVVQAIYYFESISQPMREDIIDCIDSILAMADREFSLVNVSIG